MPQGPIPVAQANLVPQGAKVTYNITTATVVKATPGTLLVVTVVVAGSAPGTINDCATTGAAAAGNEIGALPNSVGPIQFNWPFLTGLVIVPGAGQTISVARI